MCIVYVVEKPGETRYADVWKTTQRYGSNDNNKNTSFLVLSPIAYFPSLSLNFSRRFSLFSIMIVLFAIACCCETAIALPTFFIDIRFTSTTPCRSPCSLGFTLNFRFWFQPKKWYVCMRHSVTTSALQTFHVDHPLFPSNQWNNRHHNRSARIAHTPFCFCFLHMFLFPALCANGKFIIYQRLGNHFEQETDENIILDIRSKPSTQTKHKPY